MRTRYFVFIGASVLASCAAVFPAHAGELPPSAAVFAESGPFELYRFFQPTVPGALATVVGIRAKDPAHSIDSVRRLAVTGDVHQTWARDPDFGEDIRTTEFRDDLIEFPDSEQPPFESGWGVADTHVIPSCRTGPLCVAQGTVVEDNDLSNPFNFHHEQFGSLDGIINNYLIIAGSGDLLTPSATDALLFQPRAQTDPIDLLYVVTRAPVSELDSGGAVFLSLEVLGRDAAGLPLAVTGEFGLGPDGPLPVPFVPEPPSVGLLIAVLAIAIPCLLRSHRCRADHFSA